MSKSKNFRPLNHYRRAIGSYSQIEHHLEHPFPFPLPQLSSRQQHLTLAIVFLLCASEGFRVASAVSMSNEKGQKTSKTPKEEKSLLSSHPPKIFDAGLKKLTSDSSQPTWQQKDSLWNSTNKDHLKKQQDKAAERQKTTDAVNKIKVKTKLQLVGAIPKM